MNEIMNDMQIMPYMLLTKISMKASISVFIFNCKLHFGEINNAFRINNPSLKD